MRGARQLRQSDSKHRFTLLNFHLEGLNRNALVTPLTWSSDLNCGRENVSERCVKGIDDARVPDGAIHVEWRGRKGNSTHVHRYIDALMVDTIKLLI